MRDCEAIQSFKDIYWDIRPRPDFGTIELRICDMPPTLAIMLGMVALTRTPGHLHGAIARSPAAVAAGRHAPPLDRRGEQVAGDPLRPGAMYVRTPAGKHRPLTLDLTELLNRMLPIARETEEQSYLAAFPADRSL